MRATLVTIAATILLVACSEGTPVEVAPTYDRATLDMKYQAVYDLIQDTTCAATSQCASVGIGSKPCGGCWKNVVYSTATVDAGELATLVAELDLYERGFNAQEGMMSDCAIAPAAQPACVNQKCVDANAAP